MNTIETIDDKKKILMKNNVLTKARYSLSLVPSSPIKRIFSTILYSLISLSLKLYTLKVDTKLINSNNNKINPFFFTFLTPS